MRQNHSRQWVWHTKGTESGKQEKFLGNWVAILLEYKVYIYIYIYFFGRGPIGNTTGEVGRNRIVRSCSFIRSFHKHSLSTCSWHCTKHSGKNRPRRPECYNHIVCVLTDFPTRDLNILLIKGSHIICLLPKFHLELDLSTVAVWIHVKRDGFCLTGVQKQFWGRKKHICDRLYFQVTLQFPGTRSNSLAGLEGFNLFLSGNSALSACPTGGWSCCLSPCGWECDDESQPSTGPPDWPKSGLYQLEAPAQEFQGHILAAVFGLEHD